jgi:hypothetical protein
MKFDESNTRKRHCPNKELKEAPTERLMIESTPMGKYSK